MGTLGTFDSFTTARLGIYVAQHGLRVTGNNISNINTSGYTRQRVDQVSFKTGGSDRYASFLTRHIGSGALVSGINQIRDPYLDIRYRTTSADTAYYDTKLNGLEEIAAILDEVGRGGKDGDDTTKGDGLLYAQLQDFAEKLRAYGASPTKENDTLIRGSAEALTKLFRDYAQRLEQVRLDTEDDLAKNVEGVNGVLTNIRNLNKSIREAEIHGDKALELRDERNRQIDALSEYMHIKVVYSMEDVGAGIEVEKCTIYMGDANPDPAVETDSSLLVDGLFATQISIPEQKPVLNQYKDTADAAHEYLKGYLYTAEAAEGSEALEKFLKDTGLAEADLVKAKNADGTDKMTADNKPIYVLGTNDAAAEGIVTEKNDNYTIQLGKLLDEKGIEWKTSKTTWEELTGGTTSKTAVYSYSIMTNGNWAAPDELKIGTETFTVGQGAFTKEVANDSTKLAAFIATELNKNGGDYTITSNGDKLVYTAKKAGKVPGNGAAAAPNPTVTNGAGKLTVDPDAAGTIPGEDATPPAGITAGSDTVTDPFTGNKVTTAYAEVEGKWYKITMETQYTREVALDDNDLHGSLQAQRELLTEEGEFACANDIAIDENAKTKRGILYYQKSFDLLAQQLAKQYNELNQGFLLNEKGNYIKADGTELTLEGANADGTKVDAAPISKYDGLTEAQERNLIGNGYVLTDANGKQQADLNRWLQENGGVPHQYSGPLFTNSNDGNDTSGITAANINVSHSWSSGEVRVVPKFEVLFADDGNPSGSMDHSTQNINVNHMITMIDKELVYDPKDIDAAAAGEILFSGSFNDMFSNMMGVEANDAKVTNISLNNSYTTLVSLDSSREGVSGVDLNDEAMNMMQYQKAMNAAMRLMTAIDEALDRLINNTGIAGR